MGRIKRAWQRGLLRVHLFADVTDHRWRQFVDASYQWALHYLPASIVCRPFEWLAVVLMLNVSLAILSGRSTPQSAYSVMDPAWYYSWAGLLLLGAVSMGWGLVSIRWIASPLVWELRSVAAYQLGMRLLAIGSFVFAGVIISYSSWNGVPAATVVTLFGALCWARLISLRSHI